MKESSSILTFLKKIIRKIRAFFKKSLSKEVSIFLIFLLISCFFWVLQSLQDVSEIEISIPVSYNEVPAHISITNELPKTIHVTLRDKGTNLYYYYRHRKDMIIHVDLLDWYRKDGIVTIPASSFDSVVRSHLMSTTQLLSINPAKISVYFAEKATRTVPVHLNSRITLSQQYMLIDNPIVEPSSVSLYAPSSVLENVKKVETELLELESINKSIIATVKLLPIDGVVFSTKTVKVRLNVEEFTEGSLTIPVTGVNFPAGENLLSFPSSVKVTFFVALSAYSKVSAKDFTIAVDRANLLKSEKISQKVALTKSPQNVRNLRIYPENVDCLIEKK